MNKYSVEAIQNLRAKFQDLSVTIVEALNELEELIALQDTIELRDLNDELEKE